VKRSAALASALFSVGLAACTPARQPLPPAPPKTSLVELAAWQEPPPPAPDGAVQLDWDIQQLTLDNGLGVNVVARPESKVTAIQLWVPSVADLSMGPVSVMGEALRAGTRRDADTVLINPRLGLVPIEVWTNGAGTTFHWQVLPQASQVALELLGAFVQRPVFDPTEVGIRLREQLAYVQRNSGTGGHIAHMARSAIPGLTAPMPEQDARALIKLDPERLKELHRCTVQPGGAQLVVVGPVTPARVFEWARAELGQWKADASADTPQCRRFRPTLVASPSPKLEQLEFQIIYGGDRDPWVIMVLPGPPPQSEDSLPFALLSEILEGRDAGSAQELRHMGATYGVHTQLNTNYPHLTLLELSGQIEPGTAQDAIRRLVHDIRSLSQTLTQRELEEVKRRWRNGFINSFSSNDAVASTTLWTLRSGHAPQSLKTFPDELMRISLERCREVAARWLDGAQPSIAVAGVPVKLVRGLGLNARVREAYWTTDLQEHKKL
jgi:predicted Zn-dependent peptidase